MDSNPARGFIPHVRKVPPCQGFRQWPMTVKGLAMSSRVSAARHINDPVPLIERVGHRVPVVGFLLVSFIK